MEQPAVELLRVSKFYDAYKALHEVDLVIRKGEFFSLLGPSGCGKTTTLRLIAGFEEPTRGSVHIDGTDVSGLPAYRRNVNTVFQSYSLFPHLSIFENVAFGLRRRRISESEIRRRSLEALEMVHLAELAKGRVQQLSGGQQQRVALARALVNQPAVLLLDEPMAALDAKLRKEMRAELKRLQRTLGLTFVLVTHDQEEALTLSDRLAVMNRGRVEQVCDPRAAYETPETRFVAEFIGTANFLPVRVEQVVNGKTRVDGSGGAFWVPTRAGFQAGDQAELSVRPERLWLSSEAAPEGRNSLPGTVAEIVFMGPITRYGVKLASGATLQAERHSEEAPLQTGQPVHVHWDPASGSLLRSDVAAVSA